MDSELNRENRLTLNSIVNMADTIRTYIDHPVEPFDFNHPRKRDTAFLQFDEGHYLGEAYKALRKALECYKERYQIHVAEATGEHEVVAVHAPRWNRWSEGYGNPTGNRGRMRIFEEK